MILIRHIAYYNTGECEWLVFYDVAAKDSCKRKECVNIILFENKSIYFNNMFHFLMFHFLFS